VWEQSKAAKRRYGDGLLPFLRKDPAWPHPERAVNKGNDRHRQDRADSQRAACRAVHALIGLRVVASQNLAGPYALSREP